MRRPRNKLESGGLVPESIREDISQMLMDGVHYKIVKAEILKRCGVRIHNTTIEAFMDGAEYQAFLNDNRAWKQKLKQHRVAAQIVNSGKGAKSLADVAEVKVLEQMYDGIESGTLDPSDAIKYAKTITAMQRTQLARERDNWQHRIAEMQAEIEQAEFNARQDERRKLAEAKIVADAKAEQIGKKAGITPEVIAQIKAIYGIKDEPKAA